MILYLILAKHGVDTPHLSQHRRYPGKGYHLREGIIWVIRTRQSSREWGHWRSRSRLGKGALIWVLDLERALQISELFHTSGVKIGALDLDLEKAPTVLTLLGCSFEFTTVMASSSTVQLVRSALRGYLPGDNPRLFRSPQLMIAEVCLTYLNFR